MSWLKTSTLLFLLAAALVAAFAFLAAPVPRALAQTPTSGQGKMEGQVVDGTKDAKLAVTDTLTVTLYMVPSGATSMVTQTTTADANGRFAFSNLDTISTTQYALATTYNGIGYFSGVLAFDNNQLTMPVSLTVYENTSDPASVRVSQSHTVMNVTTRQFAVQQIVVVDNKTDRTFVGSGTGPHRVTLTLPMLQGAQNVQFENPSANNTSLTGTDTILYTEPIQPGGDQIVYQYTVPFTPTTYNFSVKVPYDSDKFSILLSDVGATIQSSQLTASSFPVPSGMNYIMSSADNVKAGTTITATFNNLPVTVNDAGTPGAPGPAAPVATAANNNLQVIGGVVLGVAVLAAIGLLAYPTLKRRNARPVPGATSGRRMALLQEMADLDDDFEAKKISEEDYRARRSQLKAELLDLTKGDD